MQLFSQADIYNLCNLTLSINLKLTSRAYDVLLVYISVEATFQKLNLLQPIFVILSVLFSSQNISSISQGIRLVNDLLNRHRVIFLHDLLLHLHQDQ